MAAVDASRELEAEQPAKRTRPSGGLGQYAEDIADMLTDIWNGKTSAKDATQLLDEQVVWHDSLLPEKHLVGVQQLQELVDLLRGALPDLSLSFQRPLHTTSVESGIVLGYWKAQGTHSSALGPDLPSSGAAACWEGSLVVRTQPPAAAEMKQAAGEGQATPVKAPGGGAGAGSGGSAATGLKGAELWWSWDPIFLFRQLGWKEGGQAAIAAASVAAPTEGVDMGTRTAAVARNAYATESEAAEAAAVAVAAAAAAEERLAADQEALAAAQAANRAVVELYFHTYNTGHYRVLDHIVHPDYQYDGLLDLGGRRGREAMVAMMGGWRDCLPDLAIGHELFEAVGADKVTFRWVIRGTHSTPGSKLLGVAANGAPLLVRGVTTLTLRGGRIVRKVSYANAAHTLHQLGAAVHPAIASPAPGGSVQDAAQQPEAPNADELP